MQTIDYGYISASQLGIGTSNFGSKIDHKKAAYILDKLYEKGVNYIDTARSYGLGNAEAIIAPCIAKRRHSVFVSTKAGIVATKLSLAKKILLPLARKIYHIPGIQNIIKTKSAASYQNTLLDSDSFCQSINQSLAALNTHYLDQLIIHTDHEQYLKNNQIVDFLHQQKQHGIIKNIGIATYQIGPNFDENLKNHAGLIDSIQLPFHHFNTPTSFQGKKNFFSIFNNSQPNSISKQVVQSYQKGHFLVSMSSAENISKNLALFN
jgi:aryl-alcohol dehydrogenase-like predicted oxidoreductase